MAPAPAPSSASLTLKLGAVVVASAVTASSLLSVRQGRINAAYDLSASVERRAEVDRSLLRLRVELARRTTPEAVERLAQTLGPTHPMYFDWCPPPPPFVEPTTRATLALAPDEQDDTP